jgi:hypothetical protein
MRATTVLSACATVALLACTSENGPTEPEASANRALAAPSVAAASNTWTARAPHNFAPLFGIVAGVAPNSAGQSIVYVFGGCDGEGLSGYCTGYRGSAYNVATDTWTGGLPEVGVYAANGVGTIGGKLYFSGGHVVHGVEEETRAVWAYDPVTNTLIPRAAMPKATAEGVTGVIAGKLYVLPGICNSHYGLPAPGYCKENPIRRLYRYDPATNTWVARRSAPHFHRYAAAAVIGGKFYVAGGINSSFTPVADLDVYDPATDTWTTRAPIPKAGRAIGTALGGKLYVVVGLDAYVYSPGTNRWSPIAAPTWGHEALVRVVVDGKPRLLAVGGGGEIPNNSELYTP